ncbi:hypothetical protein ACSBR2_018673 [Camellia fascicularis]
MCSEREENFGKPIRDQLFNDARVPWSEYHYYDPKTVGFDFDGMIFDIKASVCMLLLLGVNLVGEDARIDQMHGKSVEVLWELQHDISSHIQLL